MRCLKFKSWLLASVLFAGCTITPRVNVPTQPSWDGGRQDSGFISQLPDHSFVVSTNVVARFDALAAVWGSKCVPPITQSFGCIRTATNTFIMSPSAASDFLYMNILNTNARNLSKP